MTERRPIAVLISDIHFTVDTLELASYSLKAALQAAVDLEVPLVIAGDTLDTKAIMRAECVNSLLDILGDFKRETQVYMVVGNHDKVHERSYEHSLNFLRPFVHLIYDSPVRAPDVQKNCYLLPYFASRVDLEAALNTIPKESLVICHQGVIGAWMGHYVQDKTSAHPATFADFRTISGHYHRTQDIKCGRPRRGAVGLFSYIGNPYTLSFAEAKDGPKGFQILYSDGILTQVPLPLRRHVIVNATVEEVESLNFLESKRLVDTDLVWLKVTGNKSDLIRLDKEEIGRRLLGHANFKLDLIFNDNSSTKTNKEVDVSAEVCLDRLIDVCQDSDEQKTHLKALWRDLLSED